VTPLPLATQSCGCRIGFDKTVLEQYVRRHKTLQSLQAGVLRHHPAE
jgi:hypothetical protein